METLTRYIAGTKAGLPYAANLENPERGGGAPDDSLLPLFIYAIYVNGGHSLIMLQLMIGKVIRAVWPNAPLISHCMIRINISVR